LTNLNKEKEKQAKRTLEVVRLSHGVSMKSDSEDLVLSKVLYLKFVNKK